MSTLSSRSSRTPTGKSRRFTTWFVALRSCRKPSMLIPPFEPLRLHVQLDYQDATNKDAKGIPFTVRSVFIIDPKKTIRLTLTYPASTGRSFPEILRVIDSLQLGDKVFGVGGAVEDGC